MKKLLLLLSAILLLTGCEKEAIPDQDDILDIEKDTPESIYATVEDIEDEVELEYAEDAESDVVPETRAFVIDDEDVAWQKEDAISYFTDTRHLKYTYTGKDGQEFALTRAVSMSDLAEGTFAVFPYSKKNDYMRETQILYAKGRLLVTYPDWQEYAPDSFGIDDNVMVAYSSKQNEKNLHFKNASAYLVVNLYGEGTKVRYIKLSSYNDREGLAGPAIITVYNEPISVFNEKNFTVDVAEGSPTEVTLNCGREGVALSEDENKPTEFWFSLPPVTLKDGVEITVTDTEGRVYHHDYKLPVYLEAGYISNLKTIKFEETAPSPNSFWYTTHDGKALDFKGLENELFNVKVESHKFQTGKGTITFSDPMTQINENAFKNQTNLKSIHLPESVILIGQDAFRNTGLTSLTIPSKVKYILDGAFSNCKKLTRVEFEAGAENLTLGYDQIEDAGMFYLSPLISVNWDRNLFRFHEDVFYGAFHLINPTLKSVIIGDNVKEIDFETFCSSAITEITIPGSVHTIKGDAFKHCSKLERVTFEPANNNNKLFIGLMDYGVALYSPFYDSPLKEINLDRDMQSLVNKPSKSRHGVFYNKYYNEVDEVKVKLGPQVKKIMAYMFNYLQIKEITIPGEVRQIGYCAFYNCNKLEKIDFEYHPFTLEITITENPSFPLIQNFEYPFYYSPVKSIMLDRKIDLFSFDYRRYVRESAFTFKSATPDVTIGHNKQTISNYLFYGSTISSITIPGNITHIANNTFNECKTLKSITFEEGVSPLVIGYNTYYEESGEKGKGLFLDSKLTRVVLNRDIEYQFNESVSHNHVGRAALFSNAQSLTSISIGQNVTTLPKYAFLGSRPSGGKITLPQNLETIGEYAFFDAGLSSLTIPAKVTSIATEAFEANDNLHDITSLPTTPPTLGYAAFKGGTNVYVPSGSVEDYKSKWGTQRLNIKPIQ